MSLCPPDKPWCLPHAPSLRVSKGNRGSLLERECFETREEAGKWATEHMPSEHMKYEIFKDSSR